jgi:OmpA-OmpF porin, OOP family
MKISWLTGLCLAVSCSAALAVSDQRDIAGSQDHPLLRRYEGSIIVKYDHKEFEEYTLPTGKFVGNTFSQTAQLEGDVTRLVYVIPQGRSTLEVMRNYEKEQKTNGYTSLLAAAGSEADRIQYSGSPKFDRSYGKDGQFRLSVWKGARREGAIHIVLFAVESSFGDSIMHVEKGQTLLFADVIVQKAMEADKLIGAKEMADQIAETGRVALYGILFDTNATDIKQESEPTLQEMAKLLKANPSLRLLVVGHTDNVGTYPFNMDLSLRRAQAVVDSLVSKHGVAKERLVPVGDSFSAPVASNKTEEGRAKNRRVELVEQ